MYKKSLAIALVSLTTVGGLSALLTATTLMLSSPLLTSPASAMPKDGPLIKDDPVEIPRPTFIARPKPAPQRQLNLVFDTKLERHQLGYWVHMYGKGFTPGGTVRFTVENLKGYIGAKSIGIFDTIKADGTFSDLVWDGRTWPRGGTANLRAIDQASGQSNITSIPALY